jgi:hypothetical protein
MNRMRNVKLMLLAVLATCALGAPAVSSAAEESTPVITASGIKVTACEGKDAAPLLMFVRGVDCDDVLHLAGTAMSGDDPCPDGWHTRHTRLKALLGKKSIAGPSVVLCTQHSGKRAFTYRPITG